MFFAMVLPDGTITTVVDVSDLETLGLNVPEGTEAVPAEPGIAPDRFRYDWRTSEFVELSPPPANLRVRYSFNEWVDRFPLEAQVAIAAATAQDPMARLIYDRAMSAGASSSIDPLDPRTAQGVQYLVSQGYITQAQADAALAL